MKLLKNHPIQEFMATMFPVVLHVAQVRDNDADDDDDGVMIVWDVKIWSC